MNATRTRTPEDNHTFLFTVDRQDRHRRRRAGQRRALHQPWLRSELPEHHAEQAHLHRGDPHDSAGRGTGLRLPDHRDHDDPADVDEVFACRCGAPAAAAACSSRRRSPASGRRNAASPSGARPTSGVERAASARARCRDRAVPELDRRVCSPRVLDRILAELPRGRHLGQRRFSGGAPGPRASRLCGIAQRPRRIRSRHASARTGIAAARGHSRRSYLLVARGGFSRRDPRAGLAAAAAALLQ